ncbi:hypothetical protein TTHT_1213 [Thermotomaculum hydrothermale]|uniref:Uncharacterized protein n=1 Tax=Thermotomaculum hydrothermale TaxID=981385 RepID=A0A7R6PMB2_9BACT|nr:hypothetical protein [Thermotomaculum hydrothermale]BBB32737.1 hypothetical protein TTHT_1213 [Thermotomaculum hydrothermale]
MNKKLNIYINYLIFLVAIIICYFNVIKNPQIYYDDFINVFNYNLLGNGFNIHSLINAITFHQGGYRPLSYLSFYLNHYIFNGQLHSFIIINVLIHFFNTMIFYHIALKLTKNKEISFFSALFWAVSPVNLFGVTYIVQRMTSLMAFFGGIGTLYYLKWEENREFKNLVLAIFFVILSTLSKESGILFIGFFLLHYYLKNGSKKDIIVVYITGGLFLIFLYFFSKNFFAVTFIRRGFSPFERFFTELRILILYIQNIFLPLQNKIYLFADIIHSKSLFTPISTLFSLILLLALVLISYLAINKDKIIALGILSFFLFHSIESTFLPLYFMFFHRNYIASFFIILAFIKLLSYLKPKFRNVIVIILIVNAMWVTVVHNMKWTFKPYYTKKNYESYKNSIVAKTNYALELEKEGKLKDALNLYLKLLKTPNRTVPFLGTVRILKKLGFNKEVIAIGKLYPHKEFALLKLMAQAYADINNISKAKKYFQKSLSDYFTPKNFLTYIAFLYENRLYDEVIFETEKFLPQLEKFTTNNILFDKIYNNKNINTKIFLLNIDCKIRLNLPINKDITLLKKSGIYNKKIENLINAIKDIKNQNYIKALKELNSIKIANIYNDLEFFIFVKKIALTLCIYDRTGEDYKFKQLIKKYSKNNVIYNNLWKELDNCY